MSKLFNIPIDELLKGGKKKMDNKLKIREFCGDYALDIPFADGSVDTIYFNSKRNAETVKHIIEVDGSKPNEATVCDMQEIKHGKWLVKEFDLKELKNIYIRMMDYTVHRFAPCVAETHCSMVPRNMWTATTALIAER